MSSELTKGVVLNPNILYCLSPMPPLITTNRPGADFLWAEAKVIGNGGPGGEAKGSSNLDAVRLPRLPRLPPVVR